MTVLCFCNHKQESMCKGSCWFGDVTHQQLELLALVSFHDYSHMKIIVLHRLVLFVFWYIECWFTDQRAGLGYCTFGGNPTNLWRLQSTKRRNNYRWQLQPTEKKEAKYLLTTESGSNQQRVGSQIIPSLPTLTLLSDYMQTVNNSSMQQRGERQIIHWLVTVASTTEKREADYPLTTDSASNQQREGRQIIHRLLMAAQTDREEGGR